MTVKSLLDSLLKRSRGEDPVDVRPTADIAKDCLGEALEALTCHDWSMASVAAKRWVSTGGGAQLPDPWLVYSASDLILGRASTAVSSLDMGLRNWVADPADRSVLLWARGCVLLRRLSDARSALVDLDAAAPDAPEWLVDQLAFDRKECARKARAKRVGKPPCGEAPAYDPRISPTRVAAALPGHYAGDEPAVWDAVFPIIAEAPAEGAVIAGWR